MKPYYEEENIQIYCGDCLEVMPQFSNKSIDLVLTDPPYGVNLGDHQGGKETRKGLLVKQGGYNDTIENFDNIVVPAINKSLSISKRAMIFCVPPNMWKFPPPDVIGGVFISGAIGRNSWGWSNLIHCLLYGTAPELNKGAKPTAISKYSMAEKTGHPTTKPLLWIKWAIQLGSKQGDTVLDPFLGSGTTAVAAKELGRKCIGIEISKEYCDIAIKRLKNTQKDMFL